jgi:probable F420-dependent oxidoreductase
MKIRIGITLNEAIADAAGPQELLEFIELCERWEIDSVWVSDRIVAPKITLDPIVLMAFCASRMGNMKFGTSALVLPTRQPVLLAKQLATLDFLSRGRLLLVVGLGGDDTRDFAVAGIRKQERGKRADEAIVLMKKLWTEEEVTYCGNFYCVEKLSLLPRPWQAEGIPLWVGGRSPAALRRVALRADGWLTSNATPAEVRAGIETIRSLARENDRQIPEDHYGVLIPFYIAGSSEQALASAGASARRRADVPVEEYAALGTAALLRQRIDAYIEAGVTKFVMRPCGARESLRAQVELLAREIIPALQTPFSAEERDKRAV